jgi:hypothetical protein
VETLLEFKSEKFLTIKKNSEGNIPAALPEAPVIENKNDIDEPTESDVEDVFDDGVSETSSATHADNDELEYTWADVTATLTGMAPFLAYGDFLDLLVDMDVSRNDDGIEDIIALTQAEICTKTGNAHNHSSCKSCILCGDSICNVSHFLLVSINPSFLVSEVNTIIGMSGMHHKQVPCFYRRFHQGLRI